jgi:hypothetical protein
MNKKKTLHDFRICAIRAIHHKNSRCFVTLLWQYYAERTDQDRLAVWFCPSFCSFRRRFEYSPCNLLWKASLHLRVKTRFRTYKIRKISSVTAFMYISRIGGDLEKFPLFFFTMVVPAHLGPWPLIQFRDQLVARTLSTQRTTQTQNKHP